MMNSGRIIGVLRMNSCSKSRWTSDKEGSRKGEDGEGGSCPKLAGQEGHRERSCALTTGFLA